MNTFAELKRKLKKGTRLQLTYRSFIRKEEVLPIQREIVKVMSNQIVMIDPNHPDADKLRISEKGSYLSFPPLSLMDISDKGFSIYDRGLRKMTNEERKVYDGRPIDKEQSYRDAISDGSVMFYKEKHYFMDKGMPHLLGYEKGSESLSYNDKDEDGYPMIHSNKVKNNLSLTYEFIN